MLDIDVTKSKPIRVMCSPAPPKIDIINKVEKKNAIGGFIALVSAVPDRPKNSPAIDNKIITDPVIIPTLPIAYSMDSKIKIKKN